MKIKVEFEAEIPDGKIDDDIEEWLRFEIGENGQMSGNNPLVNTPLIPFPFSVEWRKI